MDLSLGEIRDGILGCTKCKLCDTRQGRPVPGYGPPDARIMVIGEAPGYWEENNGRPFVGASGKFLMSLFSSIGIDRRDIYIANVVNCRPPENRDPMPDELNACRPWAFQQIKAIDPKVIVTVGRFSAKLFFPSSTITNLHGSARYVNNKLYMPMFHPAAAMHNPSLKDAVQKDFFKLQDILKDISLV